MIDLHMHPCALKACPVCDEYERTGNVARESLTPFWSALEGVSRAVVLALWAPQSGIRVHNDFIASLVRQAPDRLVGFASVDPTSENAIRELERSVGDLGLVGVKLSPLYQHFAADDTRLWPVLAWIQAHRLPIMWHQGATFLAPEGPLEEACPRRLDQIATAFPRIRMIIAHFGYPWSGEVVAMLRKHRNLYTDVSVLAGRPWYLYNALIAAQEYGALDKVLFGSDYPACTALQMAEALRKVNQVAAGGMPTIAEADVEAIIARDAFALLGID